MKTKKQIDKEYDDILWSREQKEYPTIVVLNIAYPIQEMFDFATHDLSQETIYKAIIIEYHNRVNEMFNEKIQKELNKKIIVEVKNKRS